MLPAIPPTPPIISQRASQLEDDDPPPDSVEDVGEDAGGKISETSDAVQSGINEAPNLEPEPEPYAEGYEPPTNPVEADAPSAIRPAGEESVNVGEDATKTMAQGGTRIAQGLFNKGPAPAPEDLDVLGAADRPDTFRSVRTAEQQFGDLY